jgi:hypothetical protein
MQYTQPTVLSSYRAAEKIQGINKGSPFEMDAAPPHANNATASAYESDE